MVSINTNLSSLIVQQNLTNSTNALNKAIERMTTGFKINHASDNAAGYSIAENMVSRLSSYDVATENISMGLDMVNTALDSISLMQSKAERLMELWTQAQNGTYGTQSIQAIQTEVNAITEEINRIYKNTEYNGINLLNGTSLPDWLTEVNKIAGTFEPTESDSEPETFIFVSEAHTIDDATVNAMTHVASLSSFTSGQTYAVSTVEDLAKLAEIVNAGNNTEGVTFVMGADIDLESVSNWTAIGWYDFDNDDYSNVFSGTFNGNGHIISNLKINKPGAIDQGLFGYTSEAEIKNLGIVNANITGDSNVGAIAGSTEFSYITNCYVTGTVSGNEGIGGLVGIFYDDSVENCYSVCNVTGEDSYIGGLIGKCGFYQSAYINNVASLGTVTGGDDTGALIGETVKFYKTNMSLANAYALSQELNAVGASYKYHSTGKLSPDTSGVLDTWNSSVELIDINSSPEHTIRELFDAPAYVSSLSSFISGETYKISTVDDLVKLAELVNAGNDTTGVTFVLENDLDISAYCASKSGGWTPIGTSSNRFNGTFDGQGHKITGLSSTSDTFAALFRSFSSDCCINNLGVEGSVHGHALTGMLVCLSYGATIKNCYTAGTVESSTNCGGLVGEMIGGRIDSCYSACSIKGTNNVGGLVGNTHDAVITNSYANGSIDSLASYSSSLIGGLIGTVENSSVNNCYATVSIETRYRWQTGNIIGLADNSTVDTVAYDKNINSEFEAIGDITNSSVISNITKLGDSESILSIQAGIDSYSTSQINFSSCLNFDMDVSNISQSETYDSIKNFLSQLSDKATELGAVSNRLESALESTSVSMENITSSLSTIRDADIAKVSSNYIRQQILQQACATLLATANQSPSIALQLI